MTTAEAVRQAKNPQEALLAVAEALDTIINLQAQVAIEDTDWGWDSPTSRALLSVTEHDDEVTVDIARVTDPVRLEQRRALAYAMELSDNLPDIEDIVDVYVKGGPIWLYTGNRDFVMSLPMQMRQMMVQDVEQDDAAMAQEMGRDLLKDPQPGDLPNIFGG